jgi:hypothetical protein
VSLAWPAVGIKWISERTQARHAGLGRGEGARCPSACSRIRECRCREALCRADGTARTAESHSSWHIAGGVFQVAHSRRHIPGGQSRIPGDFVPKVAQKKQHLYRKALD